jgi:hypothetical protein
MKRITEFIFGRRAQGEKLPPPSTRRVDPPTRLEENEWNQYVKFGSRYGTKGTFYEYR